MNNLETVKYTAGPRTGCPLAAVTSYLIIDLALHDHGGDVTATALTLVQ